VHNARGTPLGWHVSSACPNNATCVEVAVLPDGGATVRHSEHPEGPRLRFDAAGWAAFVAAVKTGEFDPPNAA
jgi:hypothetical protein